MFSTLLGNKSIFCCPFCYYRVIECISATLLWNSWPHINRSLSCVRAISDLWKWLWMARWPKWSRGQEENAGHVIRTVLSLLQELQHVCFWLIFATPGVLLSRPGGRMWTASHTRLGSSVFLTFVTSEKFLSCCSNLLLQHIYRKDWEPGLTEGKWMNMHVNGQQGQVTRRRYNNRSLKTVEKG